MTIGNWPVRFPAAVWALALAVVAVLSAELPAMASETPPIRPKHQPHAAVRRPPPDFRVGLVPQSSPTPGAGKGITVLQIGDSHTAADFFTGPLRTALQAKFGTGGIGYLPPGIAHVGLYSTEFAISQSDGWSFHGVKVAEDTSLMTLTGFTATATKAGETMRWVARDGEATYSVLELLVATGPDDGAIEIRVDDLPPVTVTLHTAEPERRIVRLEPVKAPLKSLHRVEVHTLDARAVTISGLGILRPAKGLTLINAGYPGATVEALDRLPDGSLAADLKRIAPKAVVLSFGTNEGFKDDLDLGSWAAHYRGIIGRIHAARPQARIVLIAPPDGNRLNHDCAPQQPVPTGVATGSPAAPKPPADPALQARVAAASCIAPGEASPAGCFWQTPANLFRVHEAIGKIAHETGAVLWDWAQISPGSCGAHRLVHAEPAMMAGDHVHFTKAGYRRSAELFTDTLIEVLDPSKAHRRVVPHP